MSSEEELKVYEEQIRVIEAQLSEGPSEDLQNTLNDLKELVYLMKEELSIPQELSSFNEEESNEEVELNFDEIIGSRVSVLYPKASQIIKHHPAIILDIEVSEEGKVQARVLFSTPLLPSMKPCSYFLKDNCHFNNNCKFSHGELVLLETLEDYNPPNHSILKEDSLVLVSVENGLWDVGRITTMDKEESAVKLLKSGKEVSSSNSSLIPLGDDEVKEQNETERLENTSWNELKQECLGDVTVGDLGQWQGGGFGLKMLQKMGYKLGQGLGKNSDGIVHAVQAKVYKKGKGLGIAEAVSASKKPKKPRRKKIAFGKAVGEQENEIFSFINRRLCDMNNVADEIKEIEERKKMKESSEMSLGTQNLTIEMELKKMRCNEKKLIEGISRNRKSDPKSAEKLEQRLVALRKDIERLERKHSNIRTEQCDRRQKKREVF